MSPSVKLSPCDSLRRSRAGVLARTHLDKEVEIKNRESACQRVDGDGGNVPRLRRRQSEVSGPGVELFLFVHTARHRSGWRSIFN